MRVESVPIDRVVPYARNPRKNEGAVASVAASLQEFGWQQPIVVDTDMVVVVGHTRLLAARQLGLAEVPVHVAEGLSPTQCKAYRLMDNRSHEDSEWDNAFLSLEFADLKEADFDLGLTGFGGDEIAALFGGGTEGLTDPDDVPEPPDEAITQRGDLYVLGAHRLICGDATSLQSVARLMDGQRADLVFTDPPYNVDYTGGTADALKISNDAMSSRDFRAFLLASFQVLIANTKTGAPIYICHSDTEGFNFRGAMTDAGWLLKQCLVWIKDSFVMGRQDYHWRHEPILYGWKPGAAHRWWADRTQDTVWEVPRPKRSEEHPTMKPVALVSRALHNSSRKGDVVLDTFGGSGTTLIACEAAGRVCRMAELDPPYCDVIVQRWEAFTGMKAERIDGGQRENSEPEKVIS